MRRIATRTIYSFLLIALFFSMGNGAFVLAAESDEINELNEDIKARQSSLDYLNEQIGVYQQKIEAKQNEQTSISNEIELLENRMTKTELDIEATNEEIDLVNAEIALLGHQLTELETKLTADKQTLAEVLREIQVNDNKLALEVFFGQKSFSDIFDQMQYLEDMNGDLKETLDETKSAKQEVLVARDVQNEKHEQLDELQIALADDILVLEDEVGAKDSLLLATSRSEQEFQSLLYDIQQEQAYINYQISELQQSIENRINESDIVGDSSILSWPADPTYRGISATFHDPTYPFRHLFEHSGIDIPVRQGTPLKAAAPGYVAWTRTGRLYGNYVMIIHTNGLATLYAHMSQFNVSADQFVSRGDIIGLSGGAAGSAGAGLSTGPHLHFETRLNGIPVDPMNYLIGY